MTRAERLNLTCACESVSSNSQAGFYSNAPVFVSAAHMGQMRSLVGTIHRVVALPGYRAEVLAAAPPIARIQQPAHGVFAGFDFHVGADGPRLIEINTNAGGAMLNAVADWRHPECCGPQATRAELEKEFVAMFRNEWRLARGDRPLGTIAIVDDAPETQFLYPEFALFRSLFESQGIDAVVLDAADLRFERGELLSGGRVIDMVYNRLTDFYFVEPAHAALRAAYTADAVVVTPHPHAHALFADKRNLVRLTNAEFLHSIDADAGDIATLQAGIPLTRNVADRADAWWQDRKGWFFKPANGYASRGAYRGDKITRRAFGDVMNGGYVAQRLAMPGERVRNDSGVSQRFKVDLRHYVYAGTTQLVAARLYQGQTTNFRTTGGGFAPVIELADV
jgi:hypothetical protein